jgi:hypothetical protein
MAERGLTVAAAAVATEEARYGMRIDAGGHALRGDELADHGGGDTGSPPFRRPLAGLVERP